VDGPQRCKRDRLLVCCSRAMAPVASIAAVNTIRRAPLFIRLRLRLRVRTPRVPLGGAALLWGARRASGGGRVRAANMTTAGSRLNAAYPLPRDSFVRRVLCIDRASSWALVEQFGSLTITVLETSDGGQTWQERETPFGPLASVRAFSLRPAE
jgi:hypothetical protein